MDFIKKTDKLFRLPYYIIGNLDFSTTKYTKREIISADTETKLYYNNKLLTEDKAYELYKNNDQKWVKENIEVRVYCFSLSDGISTAIFQCIEDFLLACAMLRVKIVIWYNAKFDFSIFDYYFLTNGWKESNIEIDENRFHYRKLPDKTYQSLHSTFGQRYSLTIWKSYRNVNNVEQVHKFKMIDLCNIVGGGLAKNLKDWDIKDENGNDLRKLEMDYVDDDIESGIEYIINDTKGLMRLAMKIDETMLNLTTFSLFKGQYMTAGGLAKKTMLYYMYGDETYKNLKSFQSDFPMSVKFDNRLRNMHLYLGGKCLVNPYKRGVVQKFIYKYDVNSMYPDKQRNMIFPYGKPIYNEVYEKSDTLKVLCVKNFFGNVKENKIAIYKDFNADDFSEYIRIDDEFFIWEEELEELEKWYDLTYNICYVYEFEGRPCENMRNFIDKFYTVKCNSKGTVKNGAKLILNSSYGKLSERLDRPYGSYEMSENGYVHFVTKGSKTDKKGMMSVLVGSRITALSRVALMKYIREICNENVKENFIYCDTDSVHALTPYNNCDDKALGMMKCEGFFTYGLYLAPKSYLMWDNINADGIKEKRGEYCVHCKGVSTKVVEQQLSNVDFFNACDIFTANKTFKCLQGLNVKGGKALIYTDKMILNDKDYVCNKNVMIDGIEMEI